MVIHSPIKKRHCQPPKLAMQAMVLCMAAIIAPENMVPTYPESMKNTVLLNMSSGLYHVPIM